MMITMTITCRPSSHINPSSSSSFFSSALYTIVHMTITTRAFGKIVATTLGFMGAILETWGDIARITRMR